MVYRSPLAVSVFIMPTPKPGCACVAKACCQRGSEEHFEGEGKKIMLVRAIDKNLGKKLWGVGLFGSTVNNLSVRGSAMTFRTGGELEKEAAEEALAQGSMTYKTQKGLHVSVWQVLCMLTCYPALLQWSLIMNPPKRM